MIFRWFQGMRAYTVHERPNPSALKSVRADELYFVKDGFSLFAVLLPPIWMIFNRLWLVLAGYIAVLLALTIIFNVLGIADFWLNYLTLALNLIIGFEADSLIRWTLDRRAWRQIAHVAGSNAEECERRFFENWLHTIPEISASDLVSQDLSAGLKNSANKPSPKLLSGDVLPPKRNNWRSTMPWGR